jgi:hypothetical protein
MDADSKLEEVLNETAPPATLPDLLRVVDEQYRRAEEGRQEGEVVTVSIWTPEGPLVALEFGFHEPNVLITTGIRMGRQTTHIAPLDSTRFSIETVQLPSEAKPRSFGFRSD